MKITRTVSALVLTLICILSSVSFPSYAGGGPGPTETDEYEDISEEEMPSSFTLVGTKHLPPISNQGAVGSCASQSITYMQMTNAVSRYIESIGADDEWDPSSGDKRYLMSSKFTYDFAGSGTAWVYDILKSQGILPMSKVSFGTSKKDGGYIIFEADAYKVLKKPILDSTRWAVREGEMLEALKIRLLDYEQIWLRDIDCKEDGKLMMTTTDGGKEFINKIKRSLLDGNVVVTGGISGGWKYDKIKGKGTLGKLNESAIVYTESGGSGGHQLALVGYDDSIVYRFPGGELEGAFLAANSWGTTWENKGYVWIMYDALNERSENSVFQELHPNRTYTLDQFCFTDWRTDIALGLPELMVQVEVEVLDREGVAVYLTRKNADGSGTAVEIPGIYTYGKISKSGTNGYHPVYTVDDGRFTFGGSIISKKTNAKPESGYLTFKYDEILSSLPDGKSLNDYLWGVSVYSVGGEEILIKSIKLINSRCEILDEIELPDGGEKYKSTGGNTSKKYEFDYKAPVFTVDCDENVSVFFKNGFPEYPALGSEISFTLTVKDGMTVSDVRIADKVIEPVNGVYTVKVGEETTVTVSSASSEPVPTSSGITTPAPAETVTPAHTPESTENGNDGENGSALTVVVIVAAAVVSAGAAAFIVIKKKK